MELLYIILPIVFLICGAYVVLIFNYRSGWAGLDYFTKTAEKVFSTKASVIVAARNEENNIINCLNDITAQDYPRDLFEIIVVDDSSTDNTAVLVEKFITSHPDSSSVKLIRLSDESKVASKKQAIEKGIGKSHGDLIITTDADCRMGKQWLSTLVDYYETHHAKMIIAPVGFHQVNSFFKKLQALEFLSLVASGAASVKINNPVLCNGANLVYEKQAFYAVNGFDANRKYASGDDMFLLLKMKKRFEGGIHFIKNYDASVFTQPKSSFKEFLSQRIRWTSKNVGYNDPSVIIVALIVYVFNLFLLTSLVLAVIHPLFGLLFAFMLLIKILIDLPIMLGITSFMKNDKLMNYYIPLQLLNIPYTVFIGIFGNFFKFNWKGRALRR